MWDFLYAHFLIPDEDEEEDPKPELEPKLELEPPGLDPEPNELARPPEFLNCCYYFAHPKHCHLEPKELARPPEFLKS